MKEPKKRMSSVAFSFLVVRLCLLLGAVAMIIVLATNASEVNYSIKLIAIGVFMFLAIACLLSFFCEIENNKKDGDKK